nr:hypothetical protein [uncultured Romboutsia sp.]
MIKYDYEITVNGNQAKLNKDIYLFRGNKNVHYYFAVKNASFNFKGSTDLIEKTNAINAAVTVIKPNNVEVASAIAKVENGKIHLKVTEDLIDEEVEVGDFDLVFDLFDDTDGAVTIPKVIGQFHVLERPCTTPISELVATNTTNEVDQALTDYAIVTYAEPVASTNADGTFAKKTWVAKEKITTAELNRMEEGISDVSSQCKDIAKEIENVGQPTDAQITNAVNSYLENNPITFDDLWSDIEDGEQFEITPLPIITGINAVYTQGERKIYSDTVLTTLKTDLVVKANYDDGTSTIINDYTLEGSLEVGTSVISVIYKDFVTTFNVTVTEKVIVSRVTRGLIKELNDITEQTLTNDFNYLDLNTGSFTMMAKCTRLNGASNYATSFGSNNYPIMCQISWQNILMLNYHRISGNEGYIANQVELDKTLYDEENEAIIITFVHDGNGNIDMYCNDTIVKSIKMDITATYEKLTSITIGGSENKKKITWLYYNVELTKDEIKQNINNLI